MNQATTLKPPLIAAYAITLDQVHRLTNAIELLDWIKNRIPDASPEKAEAAVTVACCHAVLESVLGIDASKVYGTAEPEEETRP